MSAGLFGWLGGRAAIGRSVGRAAGKTERLAYFDYSEEGVMGWVWVLSCSAIYFLHSSPIVAHVFRDRNKNQRTIGRSGLPSTQNKCMSRFCRVSSNSATETHTISWQFQDAHGISWIVRYFLLTINKIVHVIDQPSNIDSIDCLMNRLVYVLDSVLYRRSIVVLLLPVTLSSRVN